MDLEFTIEYILGAKDLFLSVGGCGLDAFIDNIISYEPSVEFIYQIAQKNNLITTDKTNIPKRDYIAQWLKECNGVPSDVSAEIEKLFLDYIEEPVV